jgi:hypothetical protein
VFNVLTHTDSAPLIRELSSDEKMASRVALSLLLKVFRDERCKHDLEVTEWRYLWKNIVGGRLIFIAPLSQTRCCQSGANGLDVSSFSGVSGLKIHVAALAVPSIIED